MRERKQYNGKSRYEQKTPRREDLNAISPVVRKMQVKTAMGCYF